MTVIIGQDSHRSDQRSLHLLQFDVFFVKGFIMLRDYRHCGWAESRLSFSRTATSEINSIRRTV